MPSKKTKKKKKKSRPKLPKELLYIPNKDKAFHESWEEGDDALDFPHPVRILLASGGRPNLRKTNTLKNIIIRQDPPFQKIYLLHCGGSITKEYDDFNVHLLTELPEPYDEEIFDPLKKTLLILEDLNFKSFDKRERKKVDRIYGYTSTHQNLSIMTTSQGFFQIPPMIRKMSNVIICWKTQDMDALEIIRRRVDIKKDDWRYIFDNYIKEKHDSLWIDNTKSSPYPLRVNGYQIIKINY